MKTAMMSGRILGVSSALLAALLIAPAVPARAQVGAAERAGEAFDNAGRNIRRGVEGAVARGRVTVRDQELLTRVYSRIHWDRTLIGSKLEIEVREGGTVVLRGSVPTKAARDRAVVLARDTIGVVQVIDELVLSANVRVLPSPSAPAPTGATTIVKPARVVPAPGAVTETETTTTTTVTKP